MAHVKTAISIQETLFDEVELLAQKMHISRSKLFAQAVEEFIEKQENRRLLEQINAAYDHAPDSRDRKWQKQSKAKHQKLVKGQW